MKSGALSQSYIKRFNLDGSLDNTFQSFISSASSFHYIDKFEVLPNGEIVISEKYNTLSLYSNLMYRLKPDGSYDNSFYFGNYSYQTLGYELINEINYFSDFALGNYSRIYIIGYSDHLEELTLEVFLPCKKPEIEFTIHNSIDEVYNSPFVAQTIKSFSGISDTAIAEFYAVKSVELNPGFEAQSGSVFTAHTGLFCNYTHNPEDLVP